MFHAVLIQINFDSQLDCKYQSRMQYKLRLVLEQLHRKATHWVLFYSSQVTVNKNKYYSIQTSTIM